MIALCAAIVHFAPIITGSMIENLDEKRDLDQALTGCKPDELVYIVYYHKHGSEGATFNFTTKKLTGGDAEGGATAGSWFGPSRSLYYNIALGDGATFSDDDVAEIKKLLAAMPEPIVPSVGTVSYRNQLHLAFYRDGHRIIYHYPKFTAPLQLADLCKKLGIPEHAD